LVLIHDIIEEFRLREFAKTISRENFNIFRLSAEKPEKTLKKVLDMEKRL